MRPVGTHGLTCIEDEDYAALALWMQSQAYAIDAALDGISDQLDTFAARPAMVSATGASTPLNQTAGVYTRINFSSGTLLYNNVAATTVAMAITRTGWYQYGCNANLVASGAVTVGTVRRLRITATQTLTSGTVTLSDCEDVTVDNNTGGEWLTCSAGSFYANAGTSVVFVVEATAPNPASVVNAVSGRTWCWYIGSGVEIGSI